MYLFFLASLFLLHFLFPMRVAFVSLQVTGWQSRIIYEAVLQYIGLLLSEIESFS